MSREGLLRWDAKLPRQMELFPDVLVWEISGM